MLTNLGNTETRFVICHGQFVNIFIYFPHWQSVLDIPILGTSGKICIEHLEGHRCLLVDGVDQIRSEGELLFETAMGQARTTDFGRCNSPCFVYVSPWVLTSSRNQPQDQVAFAH